jgi:hypothetical protein
MLPYQHAEKARKKYPEKERKAIGVGVVRFSLKAKINVQTFGRVT